MNKMNKMLVVVLALVVMGAGCGKKTSTSVTPTGKPVVYTTFYPTKFFAERIGGDLIEVVCPVPSDEDAIFWMPDAKAIAAYQKADLIVINGAEFSKWVQKVNLPESRVVNTAKPFEDSFVTIEHATEHSHGKGGKHAHEGIDGHTWVDPINAKIQAAEIEKALVKRFPEHEAAFKKGFTSLAADIDALDRQLKTYQAAYKNQALLASHPAYNYLARRYGWNLESLDLDPEEMPSDKMIMGIKEMLKTHPAKYLIWEAYPAEAIAQRMKDELGLTSIEFSPCELLSDAEIDAGADYMTVMQRNLKNIGVVFE